MRRKLLVLMLSSTAMFGQKPVIAPNGVVNAASLVQAPVAGHAIAPQSIASIFGQNLAAGTSVATFPLPMSLGGTSVTVGGVPAPLSFVSSNQLNIQVPRNLPLPPGVSGTGYVPENVVVTSAAGSSAAVSVDVYTYGPAIFTQDGSGCGAGAILNVKPDGSVSLNSQTNSASTGNYLEMFGTGFDVEPFSIPDGYPTPADNAAFSLGGGGLLDNTLSQGLIGKAPGLVGIDQINIPVPDGVREGCAVPVLTGAGGLASPLVLASIHTGGGACVDPPLAGFGQISLTKSVVMNSTPPKETNTFSASFDASPGKRAPPPPPAPLLYTDGAYVVNPDFPEQIPPPCPIPGYVTLDGGTITVQGLAMNPVSVVPTLADGKIAYQADLPSGFLRGGTFQISSVGGQSVGPLRLSLPVGAGIQVSSQFPVGTFIDDRKPLTVRWTGGDPGSIVTVRLISHSFLVDYTIRNEVYASAGSVTFLPIAVDALGTVVLSFNIPKSSDAEVVVEVGPDPSQDLSFNALGLTLGGRMSWKYEYHFPGLTMQQ